MNKCSHNPVETKGAIGMYHCPVCGDMIVAGFDHPDTDKEILAYGKYCDKRYEDLKKYISSHLGDGLLSVIDLMETKQEVKAVLMEIWLRADIKE